MIAQIKSFFKIKDDTKYCISCQAPLGKIEIGSMYDMKTSKSIPIYVYRSQNCCELKTLIENFETSQHYVFNLNNDRFSSHDGSGYIKWAFVLLNKVIKKGIYIPMPESLEELKREIKKFKVLINFQ